MIKNFKTVNFKPCLKAKRKRINRLMHDFKVAFKIKVFDTIFVLCRCCALTKNS